MKTNNKLRHNPPKGCLNNVIQHSLRLLLNKRKLKTKLECLNDYKLQKFYRLIWYLNDRDIISQ
ncbi:CLUMA_CG011891, isoform A [Clunio marinus]|uniref:CLUMA_CG011891, isoform A n=1 Tax=Clunio marinus TaxID=568069 RepID=A0A1J1IG73_9DIPT|nr:CLUMA_CG011891, isoform A [Clunio marinus]